MIVELDHGSLLVKQPDDLDGLHVIASNPAALDAALRSRGWGWLAGDGDALLDIQALRSSALASGVADERDWERRWTAMIAYGFVRDITDKTRFFRPWRTSSVRRCGGSRR
ncbi:hypothetical protein [Aeromicrobium sp. P5_D10]